MLYELVTTKKPFEGTSAFSIMVAHVERQPAAPIEVDPSLAPELNDAILRALAKDPAERFQSAQEFRQTLLHIKDTGTRLSRPRGLRHSWVVAASAIFAVATVGVADFARTHRAHKSVTQPPPAIAAPQRAVEAEPQLPSRAIVPIVPAPPIPAQASRPAEAIVAKPAPKPAPEDNSRRRIVAKRSAPEKPVAVDIRTFEPPLQPAVASPSPVLQPPQTLSKAPEPPTLAPTPEKLPAEFIAEEQPQITNGADAIHKPGPNGVKKGLSKFWHILRGKKSSSDDTAPSPAPDNP